MNPAPMPKKRKQRFSRSKNGCLTCRKRKIRCDEVRPRCGKCSDLDKQCYWPGDPDAPVFTPRRSSNHQTIETQSQSHTHSPSPDQSQNQDWTTDWFMELVGPSAVTPLLGPQTSYQAPVTNIGPSYELLSSLVASATAPISIPSTDTTFRAPESRSPVFNFDFHQDDTNGSSSSSSVSPVSQFPADVYTDRLMPGVSAIRAPSLPSTLNTSTLAVRRARSRLPRRQENTLLPILAPVFDPFLHAFPSPACRKLFHHFLNRTASIVVALGSNRRGHNPYVGVTLPLVSLDVSSPAHAAFRLSLLSLAAAHLHHLHLGDSTGQGPEMLERTSELKRQAYAQMIWSLSSEKDTHLTIILATCMIIKARDVLLADKTWKDHWDFTSKLIQRQGGPATILAAAPNDFARRYSLEQLTTTDVMSTFSTGEENVLLDPWNPWWKGSDQSSSSDKQWEAYERQFGVCKGSVELLARTRNLVYRKASLLEVSHADDPLVHEVVSSLQTEAWNIIEELRAWSMAQMFSPRRSRVLHGDSAYRYLISVMLLIEVLDVSREDERVQSSVRSILEICAEVSTEPVMLLWPLLYAGAMAIRAEDRDLVKHLFSSFAWSHCYDCPTAESLLDEQILRMNQGRPFTPWHKIMKDMKKSVLLL